MSHDLAMSQWLIWIFIGSALKKNPQNFIVKCITVMNRKHLPRVCCTRSWIFCHLSYFVFLKFRISQAWYKFFYTGFISSLLTFFQRFLFYESAHLEMQYPLRTQERSHMDQEDKVRTWRHSSVFNFSLSSCSYFFNFLFPFNSYQCAYFFSLYLCFSLVSLR